MFKQNSYSDRKICQALIPPLREDTPRDELTLVAFFPFFGPTFNHNSRVLLRHNIRTTGLPPRKVTSFLWIFKVDLGLKN
jgi:hypothetical protein